MANKKEDEYTGYFRGAKVNRTQANRIGLSVILSVVIGMPLCFMLPFEKSEFVNYGILLFFALLGYFVIGPIIFKS